MLGQPFVKGDGKETVAHLLKATGATVNGFVLFVVGEGIEKKKDDFAAEVAAMTKGPRSTGHAPLTRSDPSRTNRIGGNDHEPAAAAVTPIVAAGMPAAAKEPAYRRILLKLSGEALMGDDALRDQSRDASTASSPRSPRSRGSASRSRS